MRKYVKVEKKLCFSKPNYYNKKNKKMDWIIRGITIAIMVALLLIVGVTPDLIPTKWKPVLPLIPVILILIPQIFGIITKVFLEWKYSEIKNEHVVILSQLDVITIFMQMIVLILFGITVFDVILT